jgi:hypothetical protein
MEASRKYDAEGYSETIELVQMNTILQYTVCDRIRGQNRSLQVN